jgi:hypothetical protein
VGPLRVLALKARTVGTLWNGKPASELRRKKAHLPMKTATEYQALAEECFKWAREAQDDEVRVSLLKLAQVWLDAASKLDGLSPTRTKSAPDEPSKTARSAD